ncbi:uracil-DNA glycosylase [Marinomonas sp. IMCC 4694]|uniref:uracil-DNA glycosylase n=1 Tax=Marinomonas sp. IMCC 4694 TaxID=2605432 RepID=UPI0011E6E915|nr:uracil-DNA glycosylase [Marinomonas sp. IMCC 4694]TYL48609.1 uracil-DNA glycosylase [Marinomonas sp. IMCC 4694]
MDIPEDWSEHLAQELKKEYMLSLDAFLRTEECNKTLYPDKSHYFAALEATRFSQVKVVILGQDPYHGAGQAHGLSFSVAYGVKVPPSLVNMYKELESDLGIAPAQHGYLMSWAEQGVLLLNSVLTVEAHHAGSHQNKGWERFTDTIIEVINREHQGVVFMLWGAYAQKKGRHIDRAKQCVLETVHPSPLSAYRGFFGCRHFSKANDYLKSVDKSPVQWALAAVETGAKTSSTQAMLQNEQITLSF